MGVWWFGIYRKYRSIYSTSFYFYIAHRYRAYCQAKQYYADSHMSREFYSSTRVIYGATQRHIPPVRPNDDATFMKDEKGILRQDHFVELLNRDSHVEADSIDNIFPLDELGDLTYTRR